MRCVPQAPGRASPTTSDRARESVREIGFLFVTVRCNGATHLRQPDPEPGLVKLAQSTPSTPPSYTTAPLSELPSPTAQPSQTTLSRRLAPRPTRAPWPTTV